MGFADAYNAYLQKHAIGGQLVSVAPDPHLHTIIAIPAYNESGLTTCLDSLFHCDPPVRPAEVVVLINSARSSNEEIIAANRRSYEEVLEWIGRHRVKRPQEKLRFHVVLVEDLPDKHFGAGLARKLVMDEAVRRLAGRRLAGREAGNQMENS
ncbi:MAG: hypothetical protein LC655_06675, partial [Bacteroidales bacterium]|nr:hypothetical protein [Bacteroidales bacterium]